ncbi:MAG: hypothetical protein AAGD23_07375 [Pseudomonadota bacterium]
MTGSRVDWPDGASCSDAEIDSQLKRLHGTGAAARLSQLHEEAARRIVDPHARRFHLTHAWVFAMEDGDKERAAELASQLRRLGGVA